MDLAADVVRTLLELKRDYPGDDSPTSWQPGDLSELLLDVIPRKVAADEAWIGAAPATIRAFFHHLGVTGVTGSREGWTTPARSRAATR